MGRTRDEVPKSSFAFKGKDLQFRFYPKNALSIAKELNITSEFNEVYFSEMGEAEATPSRDPRKINLGEERILLGKIAEGGRSEPLNSLLNSLTLQRGVKLRPKSRERGRSIR